MIIGETHEHYIQITPFLRIEVERACRRSKTLISQHRQQILDGLENNINDLFGNGRIVIPFQLCDEPRELVVWLNPRAKNHINVTLTTPPEIPVRGRK